jgi:hypothetical protein
MGSSLSLEARHRWLSPKPLDQTPPLKSRRMEMACRVSANVLVLSWGHTSVRGRLRLPIQTQPRSPTATASWCSLVGGIANCEMTLRRSWSRPAFVPTQRVPSRPAKSFHATSELSPWALVKFSPAAGSTLTPMGSSLALGRRFIPLLLAAQRVPAPSKVKLPNRGYLRSLAGLPAGGLVRIVFPATRLAPVRQRARPSRWAPHEDRQNLPPDHCHSDSP